MGVPRILYDNRLRVAAANPLSLLVSSALDTMPKTNLLDQLPSIPWRTKIGWTLTSVNNLIFFIRSGAKTATVAAGYYATGADLCTAVIAALEAIDSTPVWACTYSGSTHKFTISSNLSFDLVFTGNSSNLLIDMGYTVATSGSTSYLATNASYQSRHWIYVDQLAEQSFDTVILLENNLQQVGFGDVYLQASASSMLATGLDGTVTVDQLISHDADDSSYKSYRFAAAQAYRYLRVVIDNTQSVDGYTELSILWIGEGMTTEGIIGAEVDAVEELSELSYAAGGAHHVLDRDTRETPILGFEILGDEQLAAWQALRAAVKVGVNFFVQIDDEDEDSYLYAFLSSPMNFEFQELTSAGKKFATELSIREALG